MPALLNREEERAVLNGLLEDLRSGRGRVLVVRGEAGVGKSALLDRLADLPAPQRDALQATTAFASADTPVQESLQWGWLARVADKAMWDGEGRRLTVRQVQLARDAGALDQAGTPRPPR